MNQHSSAPSSASASPSSSQASSAVVSAVSNQQGIHRTLQALDKLIIAYLAISTMVQDSSLITDEVWIPLAAQLRVPDSFIIDYWNQLSSQKQTSLWLEVLHKRIDQTAAHPILTQGAEQRVKSKAIAKLETLLDSGMIRNPAELLAVARIAHASQPQGGNTVINNFGDMRLAEGQSLPDGAGTMTISLSPRTASNLQTQQQKSESRIIDAQMLGVAELRNLNQLQQPQQPNEPDSLAKAADGQHNEESIDG